MKATLFIGSSSEGLPVAEGIEQNLCKYSEVKIWNKGVFVLNMGSLEALVQATDSFDFAILVITPDDVATTDDITKQAPRDNVMFELGLFMGRLGRNRVFAFRPSGSQMKLPSDLAGVTLADYDSSRSDRNWEAATSPWCTRIRNEIESLGVHPSRGARQRREFWLKALVSGVALLLLLLHWSASKLKFDLPAGILIGLFAVPWLVNALPKVLQYIHTAEFGTLKLQFQEIKSDQEKQRWELDRLKIIANLLVTEEEFKHLQRFLSPEPWPFDKNAWTNKFFEQELRRLRAVGLITGRRQTGKGIRSLFAEGGDVKNHLQITDEGVKFIAFRNQVNEPQAILRELG